MKLPIAAALLICTAVYGCAGIALRLYQPAQIADCREPIPSTQNLPKTDFVRRFRFQVDALGDTQVSQGIEVVAQKRGSKMTVVGLSRFGAKLFTVLQDGREVTVDTPVKALQNVAPHNVLRDLYRWPFGIDHGKDVRVLVADDRRSAKITNDICGYTTTIVEVGNPHLAP